MWQVDSRAASDILKIFFKIATKTLSTDVFLAECFCTIQILVRFSKECKSRWHFQNLSWCTSPGWPGLWGPCTHSQTGSGYTRGPRYLVLKCCCLNTLRSLFFIHLFDGLSAQPQEMQEILHKNSENILAFCIFSIEVYVMETFCQCH